MAAAAEEKVLNLFDVYWFEFRIFSAKPEPSSSSSSSSSSTSGRKYQVAEIHEKVEEPKLSRLQALHVRSLSDHCLSSRDGSNSPDSVFQMPKLQTILSGKQIEDFSGPRSIAVEEGEEESKNRENRTRRRRRTTTTTKGSSRSLSELEFEELKGFMDLGFVFSEEDKNSSLVSIVPGLQRLGRKVEVEKVEVGDFVAVSRPYLSEAWELSDQPRMNSIALLNGRIGALGNEVDIKDHLRTWAHAVASAVS